MNCDKYYSQINDYLDNELNDVDKKDFVNYLNSDIEFQKIVDDIKTNNLLLKNLPRIEAKSDFIINLNKKIDEYESNRSPFINSIRNIFSKEYTPQLAGTLSIVLILSFALFKISDLNVLSDFNNISDKSIYDSPQMAINDSDSLNNVDNNDPILLIGNEK